MSRYRVLAGAVLLVASCVAYVGNAHATVLPGSSTLIDGAKLDYADTFNADKLGITWYGNAFNDADGAYRVEYVYGNPQVNWRGAPSGTGDDYWGFPLMNSDGAASHGWSYATTGNSGAASGVAGAIIEVSTAYSKRADYVVQGDMLMSSGGSVEIGSYARSANTWWGGYGVTQPTNLGVIFKADGSIVLNGAASSPGEGTATNTGLTTGLGVNPTEWHNFAVGFNKPAHTLSLYVDETLRGTINTSLFAGGIYDNWANGAIAFGGDGVHKAWFDNLQVGGSAVPEPSTVVLCVTGMIGLLAYAWRKRK